MDHFEPGQKAELLARLVSLTERRLATWEPHDNSAYAFEAIIGSSRFVILSRDQDDAPPFVLTVAREGFPLSDLATVYHDWEDHTAESDDVNDLLNRLYYSAKRRADKLSQVVEDVFNDLDRADNPLPF